jgi:hypothetical protein
MTGARIGKHFASTEIGLRRPDMRIVVTTLKKRLGARRTVQQKKLAQLLVVAIFGLQKSVTFTVVDVTGKVLGPVVGTMQGSGTAIVAIPFHGRWLPVVVLRSSFGASGLFFASADCTGQPYLFPDASPFPATAVLGPSSTLYFEDGAVRQVDFASFIDAYSGAGSQSAFTSAAVPASVAFNLNVFKPPFKAVASQ